MYQCESGPRDLSEEVVNPCTSDCKCGITQSGCDNDDSCQGDLICKDHVCSAKGTSITVSKRFYNVGEAVSIQFENEKSDRVWLGIYGADEDPRNLGFSSSEDWLYPCGSKTCSDQTRTSGQVSFDVGEGAWKAYLINDMSWPYTSVAFTDTFVVSHKNPSIAVSQTSYSEDDSVQVSFENPRGNRVWLGVYQEDSDPNYLNAMKSEDWSWSCGSKDCNDHSDTSGFVNFQNVGVGTWRVFLILADNSWPYKALVFTEPFTVHPSIPSIRTTKSTYSPTEKVTFHFQNPDKRKVWIGVYAANADPANLNAPKTEDWSWPCGTKDCTNKSLQSGTVTLTSVGQGEWRLFLIDSSESWPRKAMAYSEPFSVLG